ncbi:MAG: hypothetical protein K0S27_1483, partial [Gammaproteobacteria bacterium]|nr:hypothetical protein [Gammaproteobacteria bacterium]
MQHQELPQLNDELTLLEKWQAANSVEEKLHVLEGADANFLNGNLEPAQEKGLFPPLIRILHLQQKARFTEPLLHQIKALLAVKDYILTGKDSWRKLTLLRWALEYKQFAVAKEILSAAQAKNVLTEVLQGASHNNQPPVEGLLLSIIHSFFGVSEEQPIEKQSSFLQMLSEMEELLSFLESLPSENKLLTQNEGEINCLHSFIKAYREKYYAQSVTERVTLDPQTEINFLLDLYKKVVTGLSGANNFLTSLNELVELSRDPNNLGRFSQISQYSEAVEKISSDNLKKAPLLRKSILEILNSLMKKALQKDLSQNKTPFFVLLEEIRSSFTKVCSMPVEDEIITPFIQNIKNTINIQAEKKDEPAEADHSPLKLLLSEEDITLLQNTMQAILQEPANFTAANLSEKIKNLSNDGIKQPVLDHLLTPLHKEALLWDCEEKSKKVNALLKNSPLAE